MIGLSVTITLMGIRLCHHRRLLRSRIVNPPAALVLRLGSTAEDTLRLLASEALLLLRSINILPRLLIVLWREAIKIPLSANVKLLLVRIVALEPLRGWLEIVHLILLRKRLAKPILIWIIAKGERLRVLLLLRQGTLIELILIRR
jgi:hypothetical protein